MIVEEIETITEDILDCGTAVESGVPRQVGDAIAYAKVHLPETADDLRTGAIMRNNVWRRDAVKFLKENKFSKNYNFSRDYDPSKTDKHYLVGGKLDSNFYRHKLKNDILIQRNVYCAVMDHIIRSGGDKRLLRNMDGIFMFCWLVQQYRGSSVMFTKKDMSPLSCTLLDDTIGRGYPAVISILESMGVLEVDRMYIPAIWDKKGHKGHKGVCRHYKFLLPEDDKMVVYQVTKRPIIMNIYEFESEQQVDDVSYQSAQDSTSGDLGLNRWFSNSFSLSEQAYNDRAKDFGGFNQYYAKVVQDEDMTGSTMHRYKNFRIGRDKFGNRLYHPFLGLNKSLRRHIVIDGATDNPLIDINNSHPYFFSMLFENKFLDFVGSILSREEHDLFARFANDARYSQQIDLFKHITSSGNYYSFLADEIGEPGDIKLFNMYFFYGKLNKRNPIYIYFENNFGFINMVKRAIVAIGGHKRLCQILQQVEAKIMVDNVFEPLMNKGLKIIPLHDAIMFNETDRKAVEQALASAFRRAGVSHLPAFDKTAPRSCLDSIVDGVRMKNFNEFINRTIMLEELNDIVRSVGIKNRVFKDPMSEETLAYIDNRFETLRASIEDSVAEKYYSLRTMMDSGECYNFDFRPMYPSYKSSTMYKKRYYGKDVVAHEKLNPIEFLNYNRGTRYKNRLMECKYIF